MLNKFNRWYDNIKEPYRFLLMIVMVLPFIVLTSANFPVGIRMFGLMGMISLLGVRLWGRLP